MTAPSASCEVWIDGARLADSAAAYAAGELTGLDGLSVSWGRSTVYDQPEIGTIKLVLSDAAPTTPLLDAIHVGSAVDVWASVQLPDDPDADVVETIRDPGFEAAAPGSSRTYVRPTYTWDSPGPSQVRYVTDEDTGSTVISAAMSDVEETFHLWIAPAEFMAAGDLPNIWDSIPRYSAPARWTIGADIKAPPGVAVTVEGSGWTSPQYAAGSSDFSAGGTTADEYAWRRVETTWPITSPGIYEGDWVGLHIQMNPQRAGTWERQDGTWAEAPFTWEQRFTIRVDNISAGRPASVEQRVVVASGQVTDLVVAAEPAAYAPAGMQALVVTTTAVDIAGDLANRVIGEEPWPAETLAERVAKITTLAGYTGTLIIDGRLGDTNVSWRDVDAQPAWELLADLADTAGAVLWATTHATTGPYMRYEDPSITRASLRRFTTAGTTVTITATTENPRTYLSACELLGDDVRWRQDVSDVLTAVSVTWRDQTTDDDGTPAPTDRTVTRRDTTAEDRYGRRRMSVSTELVAKADASALAYQHLNRSRELGWRIDGLTYDTAHLPDTVTGLDDQTRTATLLALLNATSRLGRNLMLLDMPAFLPAAEHAQSVYLDGGTYTFAAGAWTLDLNVTPAYRESSYSTRWSELGPSWTWPQFDPGISWLDCYGTLPPTTTTGESDNGND